MYKGAMEATDITIIGASVIGLAIAAEIAKPGLIVYILEKNANHGTEISSRNSEVILRKKFKISFILTKIEIIAFYSFMR